MIEVFRLVLPGKSPTDWLEEVIPRWSGLPSLFRQSCRLGTNCLAGMAAPRGRSREAERGYIGAHFHQH